jgi:hypothetical protein
MVKLLGIELTQKNITKKHTEEIKNDDHKTNY